MSENPPPPVQLLDPQLRRIALVIGIMVIAAGGIFAITLAWPLISMIVRSTLPFVLGLIFAYIFDPVVTFFQKQLRLSRIAGVLFLYFCFAIAITLFVAMLLPILIRQVGEAYQGISTVVGRAIEANPEIREFLRRVQEWLGARGYDLEALLAEAARSEGARTAAATGLRLVGETLAFFYTAVTSIFGTMAVLGFAILVNIYLLLDFSKLRNVMEVMVPEKAQERTFDILAKLDVAVGGFIRGMLIVSFLVGLMTFLGLTALGMGRYAVLIAVIAGVGNLVPYLGALAGGIPAMLYVIFSDGYDSVESRLFAGIAVLILTAIIQTVESLVFQPRIVGKSAQLHPLAVLFALVVGANFGLTGMIVAVPTACIVRVLLKEFYWDSREVAWRGRTGKRHLGDRKGARNRRRKSKEHPPVEIETD